MDASDGRDDVRWLTYAELGQARGISTASATRLAFRRKWRRQVGNDGTARVAVPAGEDRARQDSRDDDRADVSHAIRGLEAAIASLTERATAAEKRADAAEAGREGEQLRADGERAKADALRDRLEALQADLAVAHHDAEAGQQAAAALRQAEAARRALGLVARLRAAWRGE